MYDNHRALKGKQPNIYGRTYTLTKSEITSSTVDICP